MGLQRKVSSLKLYSKTSHRFRYKSRKSPNFAYRKGPSPARACHLTPSPEFSDELEAAKTGLFILPVSEVTAARGVYPPNNDGVSHVFPHAYENMHAYRSLFFPGRRLRLCFYGEDADTPANRRGVFGDGRPSIVLETPKPDF